MSEHKKKASFLNLHLKNLKENKSEMVEDESNSGGDDNNKGNAGKESLEIPEELESDNFDNNEFNLVEKNIGRRGRRVNVLPPFRGQMTPQKR